MRNLLRRWLGIQELEDIIMPKPVDELHTDDMWPEQIETVNTETYPSDAIEHRSIVKGYERK